MKISEWMKAHKMLATVIVVVILGMIGFAAAFTMGAFKPKTAILNVTIAADENWTKDSTPAILHVEGSNEDGEKVEFCHAVNAETKTAAMEVASGSYTINVIGPVNADGSIYKFDDSVKKDTVSSEGEMDVKIELEAVASEEVSEAQLRNLSGQIKSAIKKGDETLSEDAGKDILGKIETIREKKEKERKEQEEAKRKAEEEAKRQAEEEAKRQEAERAEAERLAAEQAAQQASEFPVGKYSYVADAGGLRTSLTIDASGLATIMEMSSFTGETQETVYQMSVDNTVTVPNGVTAFLLQPVNGGSNRALAYYSNEDVLKDVGGFFDWTRME